MPSNQRHMYQNGIYVLDAIVEDDMLDDYLIKHGYTTGPSPVAMQDSNLTRREFMRLLRMTGLDDAWDALADHLKDNDRQAYADLQDELEKSVFRLSYTLSQVVIFSPILAGQGYDTTLLTAVNITTQWNAILALRDT